MSFNAVDVFMAIIVVATIYTGRDDGMIAELVKLFGVFCTVFITLHYYGRFADVLRTAFFGKDASTEFLAFCILAISIFLMFFFICKGWTLILKIRFLEVIDRWGSLALSLMQSYFLCGLIFLGLLLSAHEHATPRAKNSVSRSIIQTAAVDFYRVAHSAFIEEYFPQEKINKDVFELVGEDL